jgi:hypothetical protein
VERTMRRIWVPTGKQGWGKDFKWMSVAEFNRSFSVTKALAFLDQVKATLRKEATNLPQGAYYTGLRHVFAEIDGLGKLYRGERGPQNTAENAIAFGTGYLGRVNQLYRDLFGLLVDMYRHGLAHTHLSKSIKFRGARNRWITVGWAITDDPSHRPLHLTLQRWEPRYFALWLHVPQLVEDTLQAINSYGADLVNEGETSLLFARFKKGYIGTASVFQEAPPPSTSTKPRPKRKPQARLTLKHYSKPGVTWIRDQISSRKA